jgi:2-polyprenyl-3-methyl-5-hydroxy-6-metoxy-1,4-benzoquinol methylase
VYRENLVGGADAERLYEDDSYLDTPYFEALKVGASRDVEPFLVYSRVLDMLGPPPAGAKLLDVGASYGAFLELARERGWDPHGVELSAKACAYTRLERGLDLRHGTLEDAVYPDAHFDVITLWDLIEHLDDPPGFLREARRVLAPEGVLVVFTINQRSLINRIGHGLHALSFGKIQRPLELLYDIHHNFFFDERTLVRLLSDTGFDGAIDVTSMDAEIDRWQNVPIPGLLAFGCKMLDAAARVFGGRYRMILLCSRSRPAPGHGE